MLFRFTPVEIVRSLMANQDDIKKMISELYHNNAELLQRVHQEINRERNNCLARITPVFNQIKQLLKEGNPELSSQVDALTVDDKEAAIEIFILCDANLNNRAVEALLLGEQLTKLIGKYDQIIELREKVDDVINTLAEVDNSHLLENIKIKSNAGCSDREFKPLPRYIA